jgi:hypothetical protein
MAWLGVEVQTNGFITNTDGSYVGSRRCLPPCRAQPAGAPAACLPGHLLQVAGTPGGCARR